MNLTSNQSMKNNNLLIYLDYLKYIVNCKLSYSLFIYKLYKPTRKPLKEFF